MSEGARDPSPAYPLGHSEREIARLDAQARDVDPITRRFLVEAGVGAGMRVLDVGCGAGHVAFVAADLVGPSGHVVGVDLAQAAIEVARSRAAARSLRNVTFRAGDPAAMTFDSPFDAVVGRYVLQFQSDPAAMLRKLASVARPGGVVVFHEIDWAGLGSYPSVPIFDQACRWGAEAMRRHGTETRMGTKLHAAFVDADLRAPTMRLEAPLGGIASMVRWLERFKELIATLLPHIERFGIATAADVDVDTLVERISTQATRTNSVIAGHFQVGAWVRR